MVVPSTREALQSAHSTQAKDDTAHLTSNTAVPPISSLHCKPDAVIYPNQGDPDAILSKPIGIVTFKDIIGTLFQKPCCDSGDLFDHRDGPSRIRYREPNGKINFTRSYRQKYYGSPLPRKALSSRPTIPSTMRRRNISIKVLGLCGAYNTRKASEGRIDRVGTVAIVPRSVNDQQQETPPSCAQSTIDSTRSLSESTTLTGRSSCVKTESLSSSREVTAGLQDRSMPSRRYASATPRLPQLQRVTPFSRQNYSSYEKPGQSIKIDDAGSLISSAASSLNDTKQQEQGNTIGSASKSSVEPEEINPQSENCLGGTHDESQEAFSLVSWCPAGFIDVDEWKAHIQEPTSATRSQKATSLASVAPTEVLCVDESVNNRPYQGFPPELLNARKENRFPNRTSNTLPRMTSQAIDFDILQEHDDDSSAVGSKTVCDEKTISHSGEKLTNNNAIFATNGARSSSFWV